ncbi:MAG: dihydropteroate synthase [Flavobacteriales bacterium]|nr:dihydropteroate synthase [Flavobacteriales bacterium]
MSIKETVQDTFFLKKKSINCDGKIVNLDEPLVMGILNATPDSFFDGGKHTDEKNIIAFVKQQLADGAAIIDVGGYSSRQGAAEVSEKEELNRVIPVIRLLKQEFKDIVLSIDTFRSQVAQEAVKHGAAIINDISAGELDSKMFDVVAELRVPYIMMHMQGTPQTMQKNPTYQNVTKEVMNYFAEKVNVLHQKGVNDIIIDPGFGFGKTIEHNYQLLRELNHFSIFELPVLVGVSRKSMITKALNISSKEALNGTTILNTLALTKGANILRVHDVKEADEVVKLFKLMEKS